MRNFSIAFGIMVGFLIGAWFVGNREMPEAKFMAACANIFVHLESGRNSGTKKAGQKVHW